LIQLQQIGRGFSHTLILQTNPTSRSRSFYGNRGFLQAGTNQLSAVPNIDDQSFLNRDTHFVLEDSQREDGTDPDQVLVLLYLENCLFTTLEGKGRIDGEKSVEKTLFQFPFNCEGSYLDNVVIPEKDWLFAHPTFQPVPGTRYALRNPTYSRSGNSRFREEGILNGVYDSAVVRQEDMEGLPLGKPFTSVHVDLWSCWLLRHMEGDVAKDVLIVPLIVSSSIQKCMLLVNGDYENLVKPTVLSEMVSCLSIIDKYLWGHPDLLEKRLILMTSTMDDDYWIGITKPMGTSGG
jgi:hypothetical protein